MLEVPGHPPRSFADVAAAFDFLARYFNSVGIQLPVYTVATLPASAVEGTVVAVSDGGAGARVQAYVAGGWRNLG